MNEVYSSRGLLRCNKYFVSKLLKFLLVANTLQEGWSVIVKNWQQKRNLNNGQNNRYCENNVPIILNLKGVDVILIWIINVKSKPKNNEQSNTDTKLSAGSNRSAYLMWRRLIQVKWAKHTERTSPKAVYEPTNTNAPKSSIKLIKLPMTMTALAIMTDLNLPILTI